MTKGIVYAVTSAVAFGLLGIFAKLGYKMGMQPQEILTYRFVSASIFFSIFFAFKGKSLFKISLTNLSKAFVAGGILYLLQSLFFFKSLSYISASTTSLILYIYPLTVTILSAIFFNTKITRSISISLTFILLGCVFVFFDAFTRKMNLHGVLFAVGAMSVFSLYLILVQKWLKNENPMTFSFYVILSTGIVYSFLSNPLNFFKLNAPQITISLLVGLISTFIAVMLLYKALEIIGSVYTSIFSAIEPIVTMMASVLVLHDEVALIQILGMVLIVFGIVIPNIKMIMMRNETNN